MYKRQEFDTKIYKNFKAALEARNKLAEEAEDKTEKENLKVDYVVPTAGDTINFGEATVSYTHLYCTQKVEDTIFGAEIDLGMEHM